MEDVFCRWSAEGEGGDTEGGIFPVVYYDVCTSNVHGGDASPVWVVNCTFFLCLGVYGANPQFCNDDDVCT